MIGNTGNNSFPDAPAITVTNTTVTIAGATAVWVDATFTISDSTGGLGLAFTLASSPYSNAAVLVFKEGSLGIETTDYTLSDKALTLLVALATGEKLHVKYMKVQ
jgi:hypothetical protein